MPLVLDAVSGQPPLVMVAATACRCPLLPCHTTVLFPRCSLRPDIRLLAATFCEVTSSPVITRAADTTAPAARRDDKSVRY